MDAVAHFLTPLDLHPVIDHFTVALLMVGVLIDLIASLFPVRAWLRYMALTLMVLGALSAGFSYATGDLEAGRIWNALSDPAKAVLHRHAFLAEIAAIVFGVLALWRILIEGLSVFAGTRPVYLIVAFIAVCGLGYVGHLGGVLVYTYGAGTQLMAAEQNATPAGTPPISPAVPMPLPTVSVPTPEPSAGPPAASAPPMVGSPTPAPSQSPSPAASPTPDGV
ncbi:MAG TPA: DUF2231 domain-containing protein [Candidatus Binataceae bacterium]|nr:DUF2231 domain-containing protein [Candidatus Binataceae bacterium]